MIEANVRLVEPGPELELNVRYARVTASDDSPDLLWKACGALQGRGIAALPSPERSEGLVVAANQPISGLDLGGEDWNLKVRDAGRSAQLRFEEPGDVELLERLVERLLLAQVRRRTHFWRLNDSASIWYEPQPFRVKEGIAAYRRYEISGVALEDTGIGIAIDVGTAFFTEWTVADFFREDLPRYERERRERRFETLSARQKGQKGTLLYAAENSLHKCYFDRFPAGATCATTGELTVRGKRYGSLLDYYRQEHSGMEVEADDPVAYVSFPNIDRPRPVSATRLCLRMMNDSLPRSLKQADKIPTEERSEYIEKFWKRLGGRPLGRGLPAVEPGFWSPPKEKLLQVRPPELAFGGGKILPAPSNGSLKELRDHFRERGRLLDRSGCLEVPLAVTRVVYFAVPERVGETTATRLAEDITERLSKWMGKRMSWELVEYDGTADAVSRLQAEPEPGIVVFVLDDVPEAYHEVSYELKPWRVKRITYDTLVAKYTTLRLDEHNDASSNGSSRLGREWGSFVEMSALDVLQQLDCVPYALAKELNYEAQLAIDVGQNRRYYSLSLLVCRPGSRRPLFLETIVKKKPDPQHETMNKRILRDEIVGLLERFGVSDCDPLRSVLVLRDGRQYGKELEGIAEAREALIESGILEERAHVDVIDFHKRSVRRIRLWDRAPDGRVRRASEGTALLLGDGRAVLANTGAATLHQGTAEPVMLVAHGDGVSMPAVIEDIHATAHLNWSSPSVAQRLPLVLKRTDEELKERAAQEVRRVR